MYIFYYIRKNVPNSRLWNIMPRLKQCYFLVCAKFCKFSFNVFVTKDNYEILIANKIFLFGKKTSCLPQLLYCRRCFGYYLCFGILSDTLQNYNTEKPAIWILCKEMFVEQPNMLLFSMFGDFTGNLGTREKRWSRLKLKRSWHKKFESL